MEWMEYWETQQVAVSLKYLSNFSRSLEMSSINCKVELKFKWKNQCVLSAVGTDNDNTNSNNTIFTIKIIKFSKRIGINIRQKVRIKIRKFSIDIYSNQNL